MDTNTKRRFVIIRTVKGDKFTMHATTCRVAVSHYEGSTALLDDENTSATIEACKADMAVYAEECGWDSCPKITVCKCCK